MPFSVRLGQFGHIVVFLKQLNITSPNLGRRLGGEAKIATLDFLAVFEAVLIIPRLF